MYFSKLFFLFLLFISLTAFGDKYVAQANRSKGDNVADGRPNEWSAPLRFYDGKAKIQYAVANDDSMLYICLKITDEAIQKKTMRAGLEVWLDTTGKKKQHTGILFPLPNKGGRDEHEQRLQPGEKPNVKKLKQEHLAHMTQLKLQGFKTIPTGFYPLTGTQGITAALDWDENDILVYELSIPFRTFYKEKVSAADLDKTLSIGVYANGMDRPQPQASGGEGGNGMGNEGSRGGMGNRSGMGGQGGMGSGGAGGMGGGGMRGAGGMQGLSEMQSFFEANHFWLPIHVALQ